MAGLNIYLREVTFKEKEKRKYQSNPLISDFCLYKAVSRIIHHIVAWKCSANIVHVNYKETLLNSKKKKFYAEKLSPVNSSLVSEMVG